MRDFIRQKFDSNTRLGKKWPCIFNQLIYDKDGNTNRSFKSFCEKMKESNRIEIPWGDHFCSGLKGKLIGVTFGREQFEGNDDMLALDNETEVLENSVGDPRRKIYRS